MSKIALDYDSESINEFMNIISEFIITTPIIQDFSQELQQLRTEILSICTKLHIPLKQHDIGEYMLDICGYSVDLVIYLIRQVPKKYKKLLIIHSTNVIGSLFVFLVGSELKFILYMQKTQELNIMTSLMQIQPQLPSSMYLDNLVKSSVISTFSSILGQQSIESSQQSYFKNKQKKVIKDKLNYYYQHLEQIAKDIPLKTIEQIIHKFSHNKPFLTGWTALFRFISPSGFKTVEHKGKPTVFIGCFDIEPALCKEYQLFDIQVVVIPMTGKCTLTLIQSQTDINTGNIDILNYTYNPFISAHNPSEAVIQIFDSSATSDKKIMLATALLIANIQQIKMIKARRAKQVHLFAESTSVLPDIQGIAELIRIITIQALKKINLLQI